MHARITTAYIRRPHLADAVAIIREATVALGDHPGLVELTLLTDRAAGKLTLITLCTTREALDAVPPPHLKGLVAGELRHELVGVALHEHRVEA